MQSRRCCLLASAVVLFCVHGAQAFYIDGVTAGGDNAFRWDAAPRTFSGEERSLDGGLRYNVQGGSLAAFHSLITWFGPPPSVPAFAQAITDSFNAWTVVDPHINVPGQFSFVLDSSTPVGTGSVVGAEIDLLVGNTGQGSGVTGAISLVGSQNTSVTLTSGTTGVREAKVIE